ncbi:MAG: NTP transferase domain-containing protein, partial [Chloroflexota bacterium]|nr:NTP transferase domain-containing protein [Chloroflexota bacterium]
MPLPVAVILAAGVGRRLGALTKEMPKALLDLSGTTPLGRCLGALAGAGFRDAVVVTGHRADVIGAFLRDGDWGLQVDARVTPGYE